MAKARIKNLKSVFNAVNRTFEKTVESSDLLNNIADFAETRVKQQTRIGKQLPAIDDQGGVAKQPPLSSGYIEFRKRVKEGASKIKPDSQFFRVRKSNLTLTGQLLESVRGRAIKSKRQIVIEPIGKRDDGLTNKQVASDLASRGRSFLGLDQTGIRRIRTLVLQVLRRNIRNFNK